MRIVIDTLPISYAGGKDDAIGLLKYLAKIDKKNHYIILVHPDKYAELYLEAFNFNFIQVKPFNRWLWQQFYLPIFLKKQKADLLYELSAFDIWLAQCPVIIKIANMAPFLDFKKKSWRLRILKVITKFSIKTADYAITLSETARIELGKNKLIAIWQGADIDELKKEQLSLVLPKKYILAVSHIDRYKNYKELIKGYLKVKNAPPLLIAGAIRDKKYFNEIKNNKIRFLGLVNRSQLSELYERCEFFIFPSLVETCPRTLVEALKMGLPILCSSSSVMPEIAQDAVLYFDPRDTNDIKNKIGLMINNIDKNKLRKKAKPRGELFDWKLSAEKTLQVFENTARIKSYGKR